MSDSPSPVFPPSWSRATTKAIIVLIALLSLWLRAGYPAFGIWAAYDDALFLRLAQSSWLGDYDALTLAKGAFFPIFLTMTKTLGLPLKLSEHAIYLAASFFIARIVGEIAGRRWLFVPIFAVLALSPLPWMMEGGARVTREPIYQTLTLAVFALGAAYLMLKPAHRRLGVLWGIAGGCYWLTREEGVWILPALFVLAAPLLAGVVRQRRSIDAAALRKAWRWLALPLAGFLAVVLLVNSLNWLRYGVFRNNDLRSGPFAAAYGALARIQPDQWRRYVVFPRDARQRAYSISPAARELEPYLEGDLARSWAQNGRQLPKPWGCAEEPRNCHDEIMSAWFLWALRDAVTAAGHHRSAKEADAYYERLAGEINDACDRQVISCRDRRATLTPVWRGHYIRETLAASALVLKTLVGLGDGQVGIPPSILSPEGAAIFRAVIHQELSGMEGPSVPVADWQIGFDELRKTITRAIARSYAWLSPPLFVAALLSYLVVMVAWLAIKSPIISGELVAVLTALLAAILSRVLLLGFLEATSIPSNNLLYLLPAVPIYLSFIVASIAAGTGVIRSVVRRDGVPNA
jgi:hypothetical protein